MYTFHNRLGVTKVAVRGGSMTQSFVLFYIVDFLC